MHSYRQQMTSRMSTPILTQTKVPIKLVLGTMEFGREQRESTSPEVCEEMVESFIADGAAVTKAGRKVRYTIPQKFPPTMSFVYFATNSSLLCILHLPPLKQLLDLFQH